MKRLLTALLAMLYLVAGAGFTLRQHYCMGEHIGTVLAHPVESADSHRCDRCGMEKKSNADNGCCKDQFKTFKSAADHNTAPGIHFEIPALVAILPDPLVLYTEPAVPAADVTLSAAPPHGPPNDSGPPRFLRLRCIRI